MSLYQQIQNQIVEKASKKKGPVPVPSQWDKAYFLDLAKKEIEKLEEQSPGKD